jgi:hypothetical protein
MRGRIGEGQEVVKEAREESVGGGVRGEEAREERGGAGWRG